MSSEIQSISVVIVNDVASDESLRSIEAILLNDSCPCIEVIV